MRRGQRAQELLRNELFNEAINALREDLNSQILLVNLGDKESHTRLVMALQMTGAVERYLRGAVSDGAAAVEMVVSGKRID